jgi:hypothetical protein
MILINTVNKTARIYLCRTPRREVPVGLEMITGDGIADEIIAIALSA